MSERVLESPKMDNRHRSVNKVAMGDEDHEGSTLSMFATSCSASAGSVASSSVPHTPPSSSPTANINRSTFDHHAYGSPYPYQYSPFHSARSLDAKQVKERQEQEHGEEEEEEDEIVLGHPPNYSALTLRQSSFPFSAQRSTILKINALPGRASMLPALFHHSHHPRSLWTLASHIEGFEPFVWAIFDSYEQALSALQALDVPTPTSIAEPALESDLHPFSKLRKVDMKVWAARATVATSTTHAYPLYSPALYPQSNYTDLHYHNHNHAQGQGQGRYADSLTSHHFLDRAEERQSKYEQEITTPIPPPAQPQPQLYGQLAREENGSEMKIGYSNGHDDHTTPIPPSYAPAQGPASGSRMIPLQNPTSTAIASDMKEQDGIGHSRNINSSSGVPHARLGINVEVTPPLPPAAAITAPRAEEARAHMLKRQFGTKDQVYHYASSRIEVVHCNGIASPCPRVENANSAGALQWKEKLGDRYESHLDRDDLDLGSATSEEFEPALPRSTSTSPPSSGSSFILPPSSLFTRARGEGDPPPPPPPPSSDFTPHVDGVPRSAQGSEETFGTSDNPVGAAKTKTNTVQSLMMATIDSITKNDRTATVGEYPNLSQVRQPTPAEQEKQTFVCPSPYYRSNSGNGIGDLDADGHGHGRMPPDQSFIPSPAPSTTTGSTAALGLTTDLTARRAPDGDRVNVTSPTTSITAVPDPGSGNISSLIGSNVSTAPLPAAVGYGSRNTFGRFEPMLGRPFESCDLGEDEGNIHYEGNGDGTPAALRQPQPQMHRGRADIRSVKGAPQTSLASLSTQEQYHRQQEVQKSPFLHDQPPHSLARSLSFFHLDHLPQQALAQQQYQQQQRHTLYPTATAAHSYPNLGVPPLNAFRHGDWLCSMPGCGAHNFGRNLACIMCGAGRSTATGATGGNRLGLGYGTSLGGERLQSSQGGTALSMGMGMCTDTDNEFDSDYAHALDRVRFQGGGVNSGATQGANMSFAQGPTSTYIPVISRFGGQHNHVGAPQTTNDLALNSTLVQALGGISEVAAIQEAIKAHQSQTQQQPQDNKNRLGAAFAGQRHGTRGEGTFATSDQGGQLLIPTTLGNSPPTCLPQGPLVVQQQQSRVGQFGEAKNGSIVDGQGRNSILLLPGMHHYAISQQVQPMQQQQQSNHHHMKHPLPPHPSISASLLNAFSPASTAIAAAALPPSKMPTLLTPSGRKFATGGRVQNISRDELNPILMFWPDNEPLPLTSQIRPPAAILMALGGVQGPPPPILNTGNKGPIDAQPGDWTCGKCDYLNWRRRRVCANCFPHAEGNTEGTKHSTNDVQERVALLASVILQQQQQVQAQQQQIQSQQATVAAFVSSPNDTHSGNPFNSASFASSNGGMAAQQSYAEPSRRNESMLVPKLDPTSMRLLAQRYGYALPPSNGLRSFNPSSSLEQPLPLNLPPRMIHSSASDGIMSRGFLDPLNRNAPSFQPIHEDGLSHFHGPSQRLRSSPPSSRSSFSLGSDSSFYKNSNEPTPSPLPLLPAFLQEVVGETSESSSSSVHESPSPPSSTSSAYGNVYSGDLRINELVGSGLRRRERSSLAPGPPQIPNNIHRATSQSSIWSLGYPGDRKEEGIRPF